MEPEGSVPYPEPDRSSPCPSSHLSKINFNIITPTACVTTYKMTI